MKYQPKVADRVCARTKIKTESGPNMIVGPVVEKTDTCCSIRCNADTPMDKTFTVLLSDWDFQFLF
jgi:hypothetical protein